MLGIYFSCNENKNKRLKFDLKIQKLLTKLVEFNTESKKLDPVWNSFDY